jgi:hypothetical protein
MVTAALYALIMTATAALWMGDTVDYAQSIEAALSGGNYEFWEFGHLFWRPLGWVIYRPVGPLIERLTRLETGRAIISLLIALNWVAGLAGALGLNRLVSRLGALAWSTYAITFTYLVTFGIVNYAHSGSSYLPGLACLVIGLASLAGGARTSGWTAITAGIGLACAVGFWAPYVLAIPAALAFPLIWFGADARRLRFVALLSLSFTLVLGLAYALAVVRLGIRDLQGLKAWVTASSHGIVNNRGMPRVVFGLPRSFVSIGDDGVAWKRYLLQDPYSPVRTSDLIRFSLAKLSLFYAVLLSSILALLRGKAGRRMLVLLILSGLPVLVFAVAWQGGDVERYLPVYPLIFSAWALVLGGDRPVRFVPWLLLVLVVVLTIENLGALSKTARDRRRDRLTHRVEDVLPFLGFDDRVFVVNQRDTLSQGPNDPLYPVTKAVRLRTLIPMGYETAPRWRQSFAKDVREVWAKGGSIWITKRVLSPRPKEEWGWVEGEERTVPWSDIPAFFTPFSLGPFTRDEDGFALFPRTPDNEALVQHFSAKVRE